MKKKINLLLSSLNLYKAELLYKSIKNYLFSEVFLKILFSLLFLNFLILLPSLFLKIFSSTILSSLVLTAIISFLLFLYYKSYKRKIKAIDAINKIKTDNINGKEIFDKRKENDFSFNTYISLIYSVFITIWASLTYLASLIFNADFTFSSYIFLELFFFGISFILIQFFLIKKLFNNRNNKLKKIKIINHSDVFSIFTNISIILLFSLSTLFLTKNIFVSLSALLILIILYSFIFYKIMKSSASHSKKKTALSIKRGLNTEKKNAGMPSHTALSYWKELINGIPSGIKSLLTEYKIITPLLVLIVSFIVLASLSNYIFNKIFFKINLIQSLIISLLFAFTFFKNIFTKGPFISRKASSSRASIPMRMKLTNNMPLGIKPFILTSLIFILFFFMTFFSFIKIENITGHGKILFNLNDFIYPYLEFLNNTGNIFFTFLNSLNIIFIILIPVFFYLLLLFNNKAYELLHLYNSKIDQKIKKNLTKKNPEIIFGDSLSLYPAFFCFILSFLIIIFLYISILPLTGLFYSLYSTFQIAEVFKIKTINYNSINIFIKIIFTIYLFIITIKTLSLFCSSLFSHFILFEDEVIYYENKVISKTILRVPLNQINYIAIKQSIFEKIFDFGSIFIETSDKHGMVRINSVPAITEKNILIMDRIKSGKK